MLDLAGIMLSSVIMFIVVVQALRRDREQPWFQTVKLRKIPGQTKQVGWRRQN
jgi:hypothetical protein